LSRLSHSTLGRPDPVKIPARFFRMKYDGAAHPRAVPARSGAVANCQHFAFELLRNFGYHIGPMRSSELWADRRFTRRTRSPRTFDLLLFNRERKEWGAHVAVYLGSGRAIHLCKALGHPAIWDMREFPKHDRYKVLVGIKRPIRKSRRK
jgi:hypothetical protein